MTSVDHESSELMDLADARELVLSRVRALDPVTVPLAQAHGRVLVQDVTAREDVPGFVNSSMDGFALRASDTGEDPARLRVVDAVLAGRPSERSLGPGEAARIMTGAPLPPGADAVCMIEQTRVEGEDVIIGRAVRPGEYVRHVG